MRYDGEIGAVMLGRAARRSGGRRRRRRRMRRLRLPGRASAAANIARIGAEVDELLGRRARKRKLTKRQKVRGVLSTLAPGGLTRLIAKRIAKRRKGKGSKAGKIAAAFLIPGAGVGRIIQSAVRRRRAQKARKAAAKAAGLVVVPAAAPVAPAAVPSIPAPAYSEPATALPPGPDVAEAPEADVVEPAEAVEDEEESAAEGDEGEESEAA